MEHLSPEKINYYLDIAETVGEKSTCLRRAYGAIIVRDDEIVSSGYNGSPRSVVNCNKIQKCRRKELNIAPGERYEMCSAVHAEQNAIISARRKDMMNSTLFLVGKEIYTNKYTKYNKPCAICTNMIINAGIDIIIMRINKKKYEMIQVSDMIFQLNMNIMKMCNEEG